MVMSVPGASSVNEERDVIDQDEAMRRMEELVKETAVGDTMYEKRWVIENLLAVGRHFQETSYTREVTENGVTRLEVLELDTFPGIEEKLCTLWDISVEEDVSEFFLQYRVLDIFVELFCNPNARVKEISVGLMSNMLCHEKVFLGLVEKPLYLEKLLTLLDVKDSPTLSLVFRCLHSYGYNLYNLLHGQTKGPQSSVAMSQYNGHHVIGLTWDQGKLDQHSKEHVKILISNWLDYLSTEVVTQGIGLILASSTNTEVLYNISRLLSILCSLWETSEERRKNTQYYAEETFIQCVLESVEESLGEDKTEKHLFVFLTAVFEQDMDKEVYAGLSERLLVAVDRLFSRHVLRYSTIDEEDLEFVTNLCWVTQSSLDSGGFSAVPTGLKRGLEAVKEAVEESETEVKEEEDTPSEEEEGKENTKSVIKLLQTCLTSVRALAGSEGGRQHWNEHTEESPARR